MSEFITHEGDESVNTKDDEPGLLISPSFYLGLLASIAVWTGLWWLIAAALDKLN